MSGVLMAAEPTTHLPQRDLDAPPPVPRSSLGRLPLESRFLGVGSSLASVALAWVITYRLLPVSGFGWFLICFALCNVALLAVGTLLFDNAKAVSDRLMQWVLTAGAVIVFSALASIIYFTFHRAWPALHHANLFTQTMQHASASSSPFDQGGFLHAIVGTLIEIGIAIAITLPLGVGTAVYMSEVGGTFAGIVRTVVEAMTALPSIVAGLFVYSVWIIPFHNPKSGLAGAFAISVMMLPIVARASDVVLRVVPGNLREASLGLGASRWSTVWHVVLPTARPGLATALILAIARGVGETSPVLICSAYATSMVTSPTQAMTSLPLAVYNNVSQAQPAAITRGYAAAAVLLTLVLILFVLARVAARPTSTKPSVLRRLRNLIEILPKPKPKRSAALTASGIPSPPVSEEFAS